MLSQLVYVSQRAQFCTEEEIQSILDACIKNNKGEDITGVLLYSDTHFLQYLEGDFKKISSLYSKIKVDKRHKDAVMLSTAPIGQRAFPSWQMGAKKFNNEEVQYKSALSDADKLTFKALLSGDEKDAHQALGLIKKFFK